MNKLIGLILILTLAACSKSAPPSSTEIPSDSEVITILEAKDMAITGNLNMGEFLPTDSSKLITYSIKNSGTEALTGPVTLSDNTNFYLAYQNCASVAVKKSCSVKISFDPKGKSGSYATTLNIDSLSAEITASVTVPAPPAVSVQLMVSSVDISTSGLSFGSITDKQNVIKTISIKNTGTSSLSGESVNISSSSAPVPFVISYDSCSGKTLVKGSSCSVKVSLNGAGKSGAQQGELSFGGKTAALSGQVEASNSSSGSGSGGGGSVNLAYYLSSTAIGSTYDFGSLTSASESKQLILTVKNNGTLAFAGGMVSLSSTDFSIPYNACNNKSLNPGASCQVRVIFSASGKANNSYSGVLSLGGVDLNLSASVTTPSVVVTYQPLYADFGSCKVGSVAIAACDGDGIQSRNILSCRRMENGVDVGAATLGNCSAFQNDSYLKQPCLSPAGDRTISLANGSKVVNCPAGSDVQTFVSITCDNSIQANGFHSEDNSSCISNTRSCGTLPEGVATGNEIYTGSAWGSCVALTCASNYSLNGGVCESQGGGGPVSPLIGVRPNNLTVSAGSVVEFSVRGYSPSAELTISFPSLSGAVVTEGPSSMLMLGDYIHKFKVSFSGVSPAAGKVRVSDGNLIGEADIEVSASNFGIGGFASNSSVETWIYPYMMPSVGISSGPNKKYYIETSSANNIQTLGLTGWDSKGTLIADNHSRTFGEVGWGVPRVDSLGRVYAVGYACGEGAASPCDRTLADGRGVQDGNVIIKRYTSTGQIDTSFDGDGFKTIREPDENFVTIGYNSDVTSFEIIDDKLVIGTNSNIRKPIGASGEQFQRTTAMYVLNLDGTYDTSFNGTGYKLLDFKECVVTQLNPVPNPCYQISRINKIVKRNNSYYVIARVNNKPSNQGSYSLGIQKLSLSGVLDTAYGTNGLAINFLTNTETYNSDAAFVSDDGGLYLHYTGYNVSFGSLQYQIISKFNLNDASRDTSFGSSGKVYPLEWAHNAGLTGTKYFFGAFSPIGSVGESVFGLGTIQPIVERDASQSSYIEKTVLFKLNSTGQMVNFGSASYLDMKGYLGLRTFSIQQDGNELVVYGLQNVRSMTIPSRLLGGPNDGGQDVVQSVQLGSRFGLFKIDLNNPNAGAGDIQKQKEHLKYSNYCGPYGDFDVVANQCVCDENYFLHKTQDFAPYTSHLCVKGGADLCTSTATYDEGQMSCVSSISCNNNMMCEQWMGEDSMNCPMDCQPVQCWNIYDQFSCQNSNCMWNYNYNDCSMLGDQFSCQNNSNGMCSWMPNMNECSMSFYDEGSCNSNPGCSWSYYDMMDPMMGGSCSGQYQDQFSGSCGGGSYQDYNSGYCM